MDKPVLKELRCKMCPKRFCGPNRIMEALVHLKYNHQKIFEIKQNEMDEKSPIAVEDLRSQVVTSSSPEAMPSLSKSTQTDSTLLEDKLVFSHTTEKAFGPPIPGNLNDYFSVFDFASNKPYKCLRCHNRLQNLKMCVIHLYNVHSVSLKQNKNNSTETLAQSPHNDSKVRRQTARKSANTSEVQRDFKSRKRRKSSKKMRSKVESMNRMSDMKVIRRKFAKERERKRLAVIKMALLRQQHICEPDWSHSFGPLTATCDNDFQTPSACSSPSSTNETLPRIVSIQSQTDNYSHDDTSQSHAAATTSRSYVVDNQSISIAKQLRLNGIHSGASTSQSRAPTSQSNAASYQSSSTKNQALTNKQSRASASQSHFPNKLSRISASESNLLNIQSRASVSQSHRPDKLSRASASESNLPNMQSCASVSQSHRPDKLSRASASESNLPNMQSRASVSQHCPDKLSCATASQSHLSDVQSRAPANQSHLPAKPSRANASQSHQSIRQDNFVSSRPIVEQTPSRLSQSPKPTSRSTSSCNVSLISSSRRQSNDKGGPSESSSLWNSLSWNSTKALASNKSPPSPSMPLKKRKLSLDAQRSPLLIQKPTSIQSQISSTAMLKQLKSSSLTKCRDVVGTSGLVKIHKSVSFTKSGPASLNGNAEEHRQTARKSTRPYQVKHHSKKVGSLLSVRDYLNSSENKKFLGAKERILQRSVSHGNSMTKEKIAFKSITHPRKQPQSPSTTRNKNNLGHEFAKTNNSEANSIVSDSFPKFHRSVSEVSHTLSLSPGSSGIIVVKSPENKSLRKSTGRKSILTSSSR